MDNPQFVQAKHYRHIPNGRHIQFIVMHSMEAPEKGTTAESVARYFQVGSRVASAHYCVDQNSIVQCVQTRDVAYAAPGANHNGIHIELAGYARQTREQWLDPFGVAMLRLAAKLCAEILMPKYAIPATFINQLMLKKAQDETAIKGVTTHAEVSSAYKLSTHWDPGLGFPMDTFLEFIKDA